MGLPTVKKFCFCCSLETGGLIIGWVNAIVSFFLVLGSIGLVFLGSTGLLIAPTPEARLEAIGWIIIGSIYIIYFSIYFIAGIGLVFAVKHRDHYRMKLIMMLMVIGIFMSFLSMILNLFSGLGSALFWTCVSLYFFICINSLYKQLENERKGNNQIGMQPVPL